MPGNWSGAKQMVALFYTGAENTPSEDDIAKTLRLAAGVQGIPDDDPGFDRAFREIREQLSVKIDEGTTLTDDEATSWSEWLAEMKGSEHWSTPRWLAYRQYLEERQGADYVQLQTLGKSTDRILALLSDPRRGHPPVRRRGLVLGDVQSGKTRTYMALMNKAVDCGYKLLVVLTSSDENLRGQTQLRINSDFIGFDYARKIVGVGEYLTEGAAVTPLTNEDDFIKAYSNAFKAHPRPTWDRGPMVAVMKKNGRVLDKFNKWLDNPEFPDDLPVLVIDDESDYASVNSAKAEDSPTRINSLIVNLCSISSRTSYVAVTATPFANVFIDDELEDDLFPKDFIHILPTPPAYIGAKRLFGDLDDPAKDDGCVHELDWSKHSALEEWLPLSHKREYRFEDDRLDPQVEYALDCFLVACALRPDAETKRQSMLLHMSRFIPVQQQIADMVIDHLDTMSDALRRHIEDANDTRIMALHEVFAHEYSRYAKDHGLTWDTVLRRMQALTERLQVRLVNSGAKDWSVEHMVPPRLASDECTVYVGGNQISRGMTLDGLICSVFYRNVTAADTLLQMGRWFGYRPGYAELQRVWLLKRSIDDFRYACSIVENIKDTADKMAEYGMTPQQLGISIHGNPNRGVRITSANKMRNATTTNGPLETFDLANQIIESVRLSVDPERNESNDKALARLVDDCLSGSGVIANSPEQGRTKIFRNVPGKFVINFLSAYRAGYDDKFFGPTLMRYKNRKPLESNTTMMAQFAVSRQENIPDTTWTVAFINGEGADVNEGSPFAWREVIRTSDFYDDGMYWKISGAKLRLAGGTDFQSVADLIHPGIDYSQKKTERAYYLTKYFGDDPVLMLYRVRIKTKDTDPQALSYIPLPGHGLVGAKVIIPTEHYVDGDRKRTSATYYSNTVAARLAYQQLEDQEEEEDEE